MFSAGSCGFVGFCPCLVGGFIISLCMAFCGFCVYLFGLWSFRLSVGLVVRCLWSVVVFPVSVSGFRQSWRRFRFGCLPAVDLWPVLAASVARCGLLFCFACVSSSVAPFVVLWAFLALCRMLAAVPLLVFPLWVRMLCRFWAWL